MRTFDFIFLKRSWTHDRDVIESNLKRSLDRREGLWLIVFPEGTGGLWIGQGDGRGGEKEVKEEEVKEEGGKERRKK